jgi:penicillin-binding protein 1A
MMKSLVYKSTILIGTLIILSVGFFTMVVTYVSYDMPDVKELMNYSPSIASQILSKDKEVLFTIGKEKRDLADITEIPPLFIEAFLSAEDTHFYQHKGIDYGGMFRALLADIKAGKMVQGGSTITQQVAKMILLTREKSITRKLKDIILAQNIEKVFSKQEILYFYLNHIYLGSGFYGIKSAFEGYFGKKLKEGTVAEFAMIAGLQAAPGKYSPNLNPKFSKMRQKYVLGRMLEDGKLTQEQHDKAVNQEITIMIAKPTEVKAGHFIDWIRQSLTTEMGEEAIENEGLKVVSTLDWDIQKKAEEDILRGAKEIDKRQGFSGPIKHIDSKSDRDAYIKTTNKKLVQSLSEFFYLNGEGDKKYQYSDIFEKFDNKAPAVASLLDIGFESEALISLVDDKKKIIQVNIGSIACTIPKENYSWAHPRSSDSRSAYAAPVETPSKIVSVGDIVNIKVQSKKKSLWNLLSSDYKKGVKDKSLIESLKNEETYVCILDQIPTIESAAVALNVQTGEIIAMVGGLSFSKSQFNRAIQSQRQPGSSFKPIIFAAALENSYTPATIVYDSPEALAGADDSSKWKPKNYDGTFKGPMTFRRALEQSRNIPAIRIAEDVSLKKINEFIHKIGLRAGMGSDLSLALGSFGMNLLDLVSIYSIFPNGGKKITPYFINSMTDKSGKLVKSSLMKSKSSAEDNPENQVYDPRNAYIMTNLLRGVIQHGTGKAARDIGTYIGGKTGTTNDNIDTLFVGFSSNIVLGIWLGFDDNRPLGSMETGSYAALPIWRNIMSAILKKYGDSEFKMPPGIINVQINYETGRPISEGDVATEGIITESFVEGTEPGSERKAKVGPDGENNKFKDVFDEDDFYKNQ